MPNSTVNDIPQSDNVPFDGDVEGDEIEKVDHWNFHFNILGPDSAAVSQVFQSLIRAVPGLGFQLAAQQPPALPQQPIVQPPAGPQRQEAVPSPVPDGPRPKRKVGRPSKVEVAARNEGSAAAVSHSRFLTSSCILCGRPAGNRRLTCGHCACEGCIIPYLNLHGVCPTCLMPCTPNNLRPSH